MKYVIVTEQKPIVIGRQGETNVTTVRFSINALFPHVKADRYGLIHQRADDYAPYPADVEVVEEYDPNRDVNVLGGYIDWVINNADTGRVGSGTAQLTAFKGEDTVAKSLIFTTVTLNSMGVTAAPDPVALYVDKVISAGSRAMNAASDAEESAGEAATSAEAAAGSADQAAQSASDAQQSAEEAAASATQAGLRANSAEGFRNQAQTYANNAYNSATQAGVSASSAAQARTAAQSAAASAQQILDDISDTVEDELAEAKQSGEFDGPRGYGIYQATGSIEDIGADGYRTSVTYGSVRVGDFVIGNLGDDVVLMPVTYVSGTTAVGDTVIQVSGPDGEEGPEGPPGPQGADGDDGYSPTVTVTDITGGHRVTITDADGAHTFDVMDGGSSPGIYGGSNVPLLFITGDTSGWVEANISDIGATPAVGDYVIGAYSSNIYMFKVAAVFSSSVSGSGAIRLGGPIIPAGGTTGQVLRKKSNSDYDVEWATI